MSGETNLDHLIRSMAAELHDDVFVFATLPHDAVPHGLSPQMRFAEAEGETLILRQAEAQAIGLTYEFPCKMITLNIHSSLEAVGFLARITAELAKAGMGVNPVSGFYHDHLFVPLGREGEAMQVLKAMASAG